MSGISDAPFWEQRRGGGPVTDWLDAIRRADEAERKRAREFAIETELMELEGMANKMKRPWIRQRIDKLRAEVEEIYANRPKRERMYMTRKERGDVSGMMDDYALLCSGGDGNGNRRV